MKPLSDKQLAANRANAARSTGPRTPEGKSQSALNSRKHGFAASTFTAVRLEDRAELENLIADAVDLYRPQNSQEQFAVERIALCQLSILRAYRLEAGSMTDAYSANLGPHTPEYEDNPPGQVDTQVLGEGFQLRTFRGHSWPLMLRYQAQADRQYRRAVEDFERLKAQRDDSPNEPIFEETKPDTLAPNEPSEKSRTPSPTAEPVNSAFLSASVLRDSVSPCQMEPSPTSPPPNHP